MFSEGKFSLFKVGLPNRVIIQYVKKPSWSLEVIFFFVISIFARSVTCPIKVPAADAQLRDWKALINGPGGAQHSAAPSFTVLIRRVMGRRRCAHAWSARNANSNSRILSFLMAG